MRIPVSRVVPIFIWILLSYAQACKSSHPRGWYLKVRKAEYEAKLKELKKAKEREKESSNKLLEQREQNLVPSIVEQGENVLEMMEDQVLPDGSRYCYLPANQDDVAPKTGQPKYLPVDACQSYGVGCNSNEKYLQPTRQKKSFISGLIKAGE